MLLSCTYLRVVVFSSLLAHTLTAPAPQRLIHCARRPHQLSPSSITPPTGRSGRLELIAGKPADSISTEKEVVVVVREGLRASDNDQFDRDRYSSRLWGGGEEGGKKRNFFFFLLRYAAHSNKICTWVSMLQRSITSQPEGEPAHLNASLFTARLQLNKLFLTFGDCYFSAVLPSHLHTPRPPPSHSLQQLHILLPPFLQKLCLPASFKTTNCSFPLPTRPPLSAPSPSDATHPPLPCLTALTGPGVPSEDGVGGGGGVSYHRTPSW